MNESPAPKPPRRIRRLLLTWFIFFVAMASMLAVADRAAKSNSSPPILPQLVFSAFVASLALGLWRVVRWAFQRRNLGRRLVGTAIVATLVTIFYQEENWRGRRVWEQCKADLEAKGIEMDWGKYIPPTLPDDQNFFTASTNIAIRFKKAQTDAEQQALAKCTWFPTSFGGTNYFYEFVTSKTNPLIVARITVLLRASNPEVQAAALSDPETPDKIRTLIQNKIGHILDGSTVVELSERSLKDLQAGEISVVADTMPARELLNDLVPSNSIAKNGQFQLVPTLQPNVFQVELADFSRVTSAADYLKWSDQFVPAFDEIREALKRPYAIIPGDYTRPFLSPIPNFVMMRTLAQMLAQRTQCYLLLGQPDKALHEITLIHDVCRILTKPPTGKPEYLVEAMINVAIIGLYAATIADGLHLHAWQEPQLIALQEQLRSIDLPPPVAAAFRAETAASGHTLEISSPSDLCKLFSLRTPESFWDRLRNPGFWLLYLTPRGWYYQNMAFAARLSGGNVNGMDVTNNQVRPKVIAEHFSKVESALDHWSLWRYWAAVTIPNAVKAFQTTAYNQTLVNEGQIACALERYHLTHGEYPATLNALTPQYISALPHDLIGGKPLHYHRTDDGKFVLYSVGWNEVDDGGTVARLKGGTEDRNNGDWVWQ